MAGGAIHAVNEPWAYEKVAHHMDPERCEMNGYMHDGKQGSTCKARGRQGVRCATTHLDGGGAPLSFLRQWNTTERPGAPEGLPSSPGRPMTQNSKP